MILKLILTLAILHPILSLRVRILSSQPQSPRALSPAQLESISSVRLIVDGNPYYIYPQSTNTFNIPNLTNSVHIIEAISNDFLFPVLIVDKRIQGNIKMKWLNPNDRKFIKAVSEPYLAPIDKIKYFEPESGFNPIAFLMGGNGLFIVMGLVMFVCYKGMGKLNESQMAPNAFNPQEHVVAGNRGGRRS